MNVLRGLFPRMVLQRNSKNVCNVVIEGQSRNTGPVCVTVEKGSRILQPYRGRIIGHAVKGKFTATFTGLPTGGPYRITLDIPRPGNGKRDQVIVDDLLVGDVWIAAGQSNMQGIGLLSQAESPDPMVRAFYMDDHWAIAKEPIHQLYLAVDRVHQCSAPTEPLLTGTGPAISFAKAMYQATGVPQGILASAHGGTSMAQWDPAKKGMKSDSLYGAMCRRVAKNGGAVAGMIWYQGENETNPTDSSHYTTRMKTLVHSLRRDLKSRTMPWVICQLSRFIGSSPINPCWDSIRDQQRQLPKKIKHLSVVPTIDLTLDDQIHLSGQDACRLGRRMAQAMRGVQGDRRAGLPPIEIKRMAMAVQPIVERGHSQVIIEFNHVQGSLKCPVRPTGFTVCDSQRQNNLIYAAQIDGDRVILRCFASPGMIQADRWLGYGLGTDPDCHITDEADRALPAFGPIPIGKPKALTGFFTVAQVSRLLPSEGKLKKLVYSSKQDDLELTRRMFVNGNFCSRHEEFLAIAPKDVLAYYRYPIRLHQAMSLTARLGYDGPLKLFIDGREAFFDPDGTNPALMDEVRISLGKLTEGEHEILIALGSNGGQAWGVFLRLERTDLTMSQIENGLGPNQLPQLML